MQRWSIGHSRRRHGAHSVSSRTTRARIGDGRRLGPVGRAEHGHERRAERRGEVHRARIVGEQQPQLLEHADEPGERRLAAQHARGPAELGRDALAERALGLRADDRDPGAEAARHERGGGREALRRPALRRAVEGPGIDADPGARVPEQGLAASGPLRRARERGVGRALDREPQAFEHRPIVVHLALAPNAFGNAAAPRQQRAARVGRVSPALGDRGAPQRERRAERVRQQHAEVEAPPERRRVLREPAALEDRVHLAHRAIQLPHPRSRQHLESRGRVEPPQVAQRRKRQHHVADPVRRPDDDAGGGAHLTVDPSRP